MCNFFSFKSDGRGNLKYFDWKLRKKILSKKLNLEADSHSSISSYFQLDDDRWNSGEYNPLTGKFVLDSLVTTDDQDLVIDSLAMMDFSKIVKPLIIKPIDNPFQLDASVVSKKEITLLKKWASVGDSVWGSVWDSVEASVGDSVWDSVWDSVRDSVWDSVRDSVWDSVRDSVRAYVGSFFNLPRSGWKYTDRLKTTGHPFASCMKLWESGFVPSFDGTTWRLHAGPDARVVYEMKGEHR